MGLRSGCVRSATVIAAGAVASWVYDLPFGENTVSRWKTLLAGWEFTGIGTFEAGPPYSISMGVDTAFIGAAVTVYPDLAGPLVYENVRASNGIYLSPTNFVAPPFGQYGTLTRNQFHGPGLDNFDLGLIKNLPLAERLHLQLRGELFNAFNHAQFQFAGSSLANSISTPAGATMPVINYVDPSEFGRVTAWPSRVVQFAAKLIW